MNSYRLIDSGQFKKLEQVGPYRIVRPSPSAVWPKSLHDQEWSNLDAEFHRHSDGNGEWEIHNNKINEPWQIEINKIKLKLKLTSFGHLGLFAEQEKNWLQIQEIIAAERKDKIESFFSVLNLFAYTGGSTLFAAAAGAEVVHLDASKSSVQWARENAEASGLSERPVRWIVDDVQDFVKKEDRRGRRYHGVILDPPSYGRGAKNQIWKIEEHLSSLLVDIKKILAPDFSFVLLSAHSPGYTPVAMENLLKMFGSDGQMESGEMIIRDDQGKALPSGAYCFYTRR